MKYKKKHQTKRKHWTAEEDHAIVTLVNNCQDVKWNEVAVEIGMRFGIHGRSGKQCRERWHNHLDPNIVKGEWTLEEQQLLFAKHKQYGNTWSHIREYLPGRSENALKNQFYSTLRRQFKKWKGCEPTRSQLKKYDSVMTNQILTALKRKVKVRTTKPEKSNSFTLADLNPVDAGSDHSEDLKELKEPEYPYLPLATDL